ncbi:hypothetical protein PIB30_049644 [Stylosanthes scabra]|uniref:Uncharacterized protein n=1 Tax=Stylosanthes scabra TaxID=79078 RepID=A0ABU6RHF5_9FABA|nr:hypothetical protein [Stylosanthes scabra]
MISTPRIASQLYTCAQRTVPSSSMRRANAGNNDLEGEEREHGKTERRKERRRRRPREGSSPPSSMVERDGESKRERDGLGESYGAARGSITATVKLSVVVVKGCHVVTVPLRLTTIDCAVNFVVIAAVLSLSFLHAKENSMVVVGLVVSTFEPPSPICYHRRRWRSEKERGRTTDRGGRMGCLSHRLALPP